MENILKKIRPTKNWIKFKQYYKTWLGWLEQQFCKPDAEARIDCICYKAKNLKEKYLNERMKEHCKFKEDSCKKYCLKYCDHFVGESRWGQPMFDCQCSMSNQCLIEKHLLPSHNDVEEYLDNFTSGKMCLS